MGVPLEEMDEVFGEGDRESCAKDEALNISLDAGSDDEDEDEDSETLSLVRGASTQSYTSPSR